MAVSAEVTMSGAARCHLRPYVPGDENAILALHNRIAPKSRSLAHWRWKYQDNPSGSMFVFVAEDETGKIVGHYGTIPASACVGGHRGRMVQVVDAMVDLEYRQALRKHGLFIRVALFAILKFNERVRASDPDAPEFRSICYGFPVLSHLRLGEKFLGYRSLSPVGSLAASVHELRRHLQLTAADMAFQVRQQTHVDASADRLWSRCADEMPTAIIRDQTYLNWRYRDCPDQSFRILLAENRFTGDLEGLAVLSIGWQDRPAVVIADWLVPGRNISGARALLRAALTIAEEERCQEILAWFPAHSSAYIDLVTLGFRPISSEYWLVARSFWDALVPETIESTWYYTLGDSDLV